MHCEEADPMVFIKEHRGCKARIPMTRGQIALDLSKHADCERYYSVEYTKKNFTASNKTNTFGLAKISEILSGHCHV